MPRIQFIKEISTISVENGANLMRSLLDNNLPVASSCHGQGVCSKCKIKVVNGEHALSPESPQEIELRRRNKIPDGYRISCQSKVLGDISIDTNYW